MRAVTNLRSRPGRPRWQLTTRPSTAVLLGLASLAAAGVQVALFSSPPLWYQVGVAGFWALVGLAFLGSALGTRVRVRRAAAEAATRPPVDAAPFVPVPVRPARPRRHDEARGPHVPAEVGEPTDPVVTAEATTRMRRPSPTPRRAAAGSTAGTGVRTRHAVRAVALAESASRPLPVPDEAVTPAARAGERPHLTAETIAIRDGRVLPQPRSGRAARPDDEALRPAAPVPVSSVPTSVVPASPALDRPTPAGRTPAEPAPDLPEGAVPRPRRAPEGRSRSASPSAPEELHGGRRPTLGQGVPESGRPRPTGSGRRRLEEGPAGAPRALSGTSRHTAPTSRGRRTEVEAPAPEVRPRVPFDADATPPFGGGMTFGAHAAPAREPWAPVPREPVSSSFPRRTAPPATPGRHATDEAVPARHAARSQPTR